MRRLMVLIVALAGLMFVAQRALALSEVLHSPKIFWPAGYDTKTAEEVVRTLSNKELDFRGGLISYWEPKWSTTLVYGGDTDALNGLLADLRKLPGFRIEVSFSKDLVRESGTGLPAGSWWVQYSHVKRNTLSIRINLAAKKQVDPEQLKLWFSTTGKDCKTS